MHRLFRGLAILAGLILLWANAGAAGPSSPASRTPPAVPAPTPFALPPSTARLHPALRRILAEGQADTFHRIIVEWPRADEIVRSAASAPDRLTRRGQVIAALQADAEQHAAALQEALATAIDQGLARNVRAFWISPVIALEARPELIIALAARDDVAQVRPDEQITLDLPQFDAVVSPQSAASIAWNLAMVRADLAESALGLDGTGVVVANLDTGVDWQHPALLTKYRGYREHAPAVHHGNWHVSTDEPYVYPGDGNGHGTHTMGTMVGDDGAGNRVGVAPGARWIAVKLFDNNGSTYESWIHDAFQWILAPEGDPALAPDVVNNSWGTPAGSDTRYRGDLQALRAAGILPVFSAGNSGPQTETISAPASYSEALAVGALDEQRVVASFSSRGPSPWGNVKPDLSAPGVNVVSSFTGGGWAKGTGTSMAAPHVAGLAALLWQARPGLSVEQIEGILRTTTQPSDEDAPNNSTGWGLVDAYAAGLQVTASGELTGRVVRTDDAGIPDAALSILAHESTRNTVHTRADATGTFTVALQPGLYDVEAQAFGFAAGSAAGFQVVEGGRAYVTVTLAALPAGAVFGRVVDSQTGSPISATISAEGTPISLHNDPTTGLYSLALPAGSWELGFLAEAHRIEHRPVTVTAGIGQEINPALLPAPRILLVDSGRWYYGSEIAYFTDALEALAYPFDLWPITDPRKSDGLPGQRPPLNALQAHDVVIWSAPSDSPGLVSAGRDLSTYLRSGGRLLVSGQDVAYLDGGGSLISPPADYFYTDMDLAWQAEGNLAALSGVPAGPLAGVTLTLNTADSAQNQIHPDSALIGHVTLANPALIWSDGAIGGAVTGACRPFRAAWMGFGLEGAGPRATRIETMDRILNWFVAPPTSYGLMSAAISQPLIGRPGSVLTDAFQLNTTGVLPDTIDLHVDGGPWPLVVALPDGHSASGDTSFPMYGCASATIGVNIAIPSGSPVDARAAYTLTIRSRGDPAVAQTVAINAKTPAPILFVDHERWFSYADSYTKTLDALDLAYDRFDTLGGTTTPVTDTLLSYGLAIWATGYDWYAPLTREDETRLAAFLDHGGRLLLTGQDILDVTGMDAFVRDRLGIAEASLTVTTTEVLSLPGSPVGADLGPWRLIYPFRNWSDAVVPRPGARGMLQDQHQLTTGIANSGPDWRTAFFPFPLEALDDAARQSLIGRTMLWLSPLGESRLEAPAFAASGSRIPVTLTLGLATAAPRSGLSARLPLPPGVDLVPGSVRGPWSYDAAEKALKWMGSLAPSAPLTLGADLSLPAAVPEAGRVPLRAYLYDGAGSTVTADAPVAVDVPWLAVAEESSLSQAAPGATVRYTITVQNLGLLPATARLTDTLPSELKLIPGSVWAGRGTVTPGKTRVLWTDSLEPGARTEIGFAGEIALARRGARVTDWTEVEDDRGRRAVAWSAVTVPAWLYLPLAVR